MKKIVRRKGSMRDLYGHTGFAPQEQEEFRRKNQDKLLRAAEEHPQGKKKDENFYRLQQEEQDTR